MQYSHADFMRNDWPILREALEHSVISASKSMIWIDTTRKSPNREFIYQETLKQIRILGWSDKMIKAMRIAITAMESIRHGLATTRGVTDDYRNSYSRSCVLSKELSLRVISDLESE